MTEPTVEQARSLFKQLLSDCAAAVFGGTRPTHAELLALQTEFDYCLDALEAAVVRRECERASWLVNALEAIIKDDGLSSHIAARALAEYRGERGRIAL